MSGVPRGIQGCVQGCMQRYPRTALTPELERCRMPLSQRCYCTRNVCNVIPDTACNVIPDTARTLFIINSRAVGYTGNIELVE